MERKEHRPIETTETRFVGVSIPVPLHQEMREVAFQEGTSATQLLRKAIVQYLDKRVKR